MYKRGFNRVICLLITIFLFCIISCDVDSILKAGKFFNGFSTWNLSGSSQVQEKEFRNSTSEFLNEMKTGDNEEDKEKALNDLIDSVISALGGTVSENTIKSVFDEPYGDEASIPGQYSDFVLGLKDATENYIDKLKDFSPDLADSLKKISDSMSLENPSVGDITTYYMIKTVATTIEDELANQDGEAISEWMTSIYDEYTKGGTPSNTDSLGTYLDYAQVMSVIYGVDLSITNVVDNFIKK